MPRTSAEAFLNITRPLPVAALLVTGDGKILAANKAARDLFSMIEFSAANLRDLVADPVKMDQSLRLWATSRECLPSSFQLRHRPEEVIRCDGAVLEPATRKMPACLILSCAPRSQAPATRLFVQLNKTIATLQKQLFEEDAKQKERLDAFKTAASMFAHETANPLNFISTSLQLLEQELKRRNAVDPLFTSTLEGVCKEIQRLTSLVNEFRLLAVPKLLDLRPVNLVDVVKEIVALERPTFEAAGIAIDTEFDGVQPILMLDQDKIKQAIVNLCKNAYEAMTRGGRLTISGRQGPDRSFVLQFRDTGVGIPEDVNVFRLFTSTKPQGTGLGLPLVREIVSAHKGTVNYTSKPGEGTVFTLVLPSG